MFWSKLCKSTWNCAWSLAFPVFISPINCMEYVWKSSLWIGIFQRATQRARMRYWPTIYRAGAAVVLTITSLFIFLYLGTSVFWAWFLTFQSNIWCIFIRWIKYSLLLVVLLVLLPYSASTINYLLVCTERIWTWESI